METSLLLPDAPDYSGRAAAASAPGGRRRSACTTAFRRGSGIFPIAGSSHLHLHDDDADAHRSADSVERRRSSCSGAFRRGSIIHMAHNNFYHHQLENDNNDNGDEVLEDIIVEVSTLELFSDLVIVVAIHIVAGPLEEYEQEHSNSIPWYLIRVFMLWFVWHRSMVFMNASAICQQTECITHYILVFVWMAFVLVMTQAFSANNNVLAMQLFLILRALQTLASYKLLVWTPKPDCVDREQHNNMKELVPQMAVAYVITELLPFSIAFWLSKKTESPTTIDAGDDDDDSDTVFLVAAMTSVVLILASLFWYAYLHDQTPNEDIEEQEQELIATTTTSLSERTSSYKVSFNPNHLRERYEVVTLVFIGEVCFAAAHFHIPGGTQGDNKTILLAVVSAATALLMAFAAYLLIFVTQPAEQTEFWIRSVKHRVGGIILYVGLFCAIPGIGAGVVRVMTMEVMHDGRNAMEASSSEQHHSNSCSPHTSGLLCYASGSFLILSALMNLCHLEGDCLVKMGIWARSTVRFICGVGCLLLSIIPSFATTNGILSCIATIPSPTFLCPLLMLTSAAIEVWAVGSMHWLG